jgi:hypothetical protein
MFLLPEVFGERAGRAGCQSAWVLVHGRIEGIATHNLMDVGRWQLSGLDQGVETLNAQGRAAKAKRSLRWCNKGGDLVEPHLD